MSSLVVTASECTYDDQKKGNRFYSYKRHRSLLPSPTGAAAPDPSPWGDMWDCGIQIL